MVQQAPVIKDDPMYRLLKEGKIDEFNARKAKGETCDLRGADFRSVDLTGIDADNLDFRGCYFRMCNLRGVDFSSANLEGASIHGAQISGAYFPADLCAEEITLSLEHGTRMRYRKCE